MAEPTPLGPTRARATRTEAMRAEQARPRPMRTTAAQPKPVRTKATETDADDSDATETEDPSFREMEVTNWPETKTESLERTLDRAESILEGQLMVLTDTDDKAIKTVRIGIVLLGVAASSSRLVPETVPTNVWMKAGGLLVVGSIVVGIFTHSTSSPDYGPGPDYVRSDIESGATNEDVYLELLHGYKDAIANNCRMVNDSSRYLFATQVLLVAGIVVGSIGVFVI